MAAGPWRKSKKRLEKRNFSTSYVKGGPQNPQRVVKKATRPESSLDEAKEQGSFDPVHGDRFFVIPAESAHWPPSAEVRKRLESDSLHMATFDKKVVPKKDPSISGGKANRAREGELKTPSNVDLSSRRTVFS